MILSINSGDSVPVKGNMVVTYVPIEEEIGEIQPMYGKVSTNRPWGKPSIFYQEGIAKVLDHII